jgi:hypothetical protein
MNLTTSVDSFDKLNCFPGVVYEHANAKRHFPQTEDVRSCCWFWQRGFHPADILEFQEKLITRKRAYAAHGERGLINSKPCPKNPKLRTPLPIEEKILYLRRNYHFGQVRISWYLARYHDIKISSGGVYKVLKP